MSVEPPPSNLEAEQAVCGSCILSAEAIAYAVEALKPDDFYRDAHRNIFEAIVALHTRNEAVDLITLSDELTSRNQLEEVGGALYLMILLEAPSTAANIAYYSNIVLERSIQRRYQEVARQLYKLTSGEAFTSAADLTQQAEKLILDASQERKVKGEFKSFKAGLHTVLDDIDNRYGGVGQKGLMLPFADLNYMMGGLKGGELTILGARPSVGKTSLALQIALHLSLRANYVPVFSMEMPFNTIMARILCTEARINSANFQAATFSKEEWERIASATERIQDAKLYIDDTGHVTVSHVKSRCTQLQRTKGLDLIVIDYLQLMSTGSKPKENRVLDIGEISRGLKLLARELDVPVLVLAQVGRECEKRPNKRPMLSDLRESGSIEADADNVLLIYRDAVYKPKDESDGRTMEEAEINVAKNRMGPTGIAKVGFWPNWALFADVERYRE
jgi:replicative DNA helicase